MRKTELKSREKGLKNNNYWPSKLTLGGDSFIPSMKSQNGIFWMVHWWVLGHSSWNYWPNKVPQALHLLNPQKSPQALVYLYLVVDIGPICPTWTNHAPTKLSWLTYVLMLIIYCEYQVCSFQKVEFLDTRAFLTTNNNCVASTCLWTQSQPNVIFLFGERIVSHSDYLTECSNI